MTAHARLLAGPGTGKTHTMARRVVYLVTELGVTPSEILILSFTRMAAGDVRSKIQSQLAPYTEEMPHVSTLHAFALRQLRRNSAVIDSLPQPVRIADDWEEARVIYEDMKLLLDRKLTAIKQNFRELSADWETLRADTDDWRANLADPQFVGTWDEHRRVYGYTLRSELVYQLKRAVSQNDEFVLAPEFQHVLIDEYQDLNPCDQAVAAALAAKGVNLLVCGDDDQSIYGFRFADPDGIRDFVQDYAGAADLLLTECQRCDPAILESALWVAQQDRHRVPKPLNAVPGRSHGDVHLLSFPTGMAEAQGVARLCRRYIDEGTSPGEILVLVRSDRHGVLSTPLQQALEVQGVPVKTNTASESIFDEKHGRKVLSMLQLITNSHDHLAWRTRIELAEGMGPNTVRAIYGFAVRKGIGFSQALRCIPDFAVEIARTQQALQGLVDNTLAAIAQHQHDEVPESERTVEDLLAMVREVAEGEVAQENNRDEVMAQIEEIATTSASSTLQDLLTAIAINRDFREPDLEEGKVAILTMHKAKGLSADAVFIIAAEDEILPQGETGEQIADERRLLYVSMTRARHKLFITFSNRRTGGQSYTGRAVGEERRHVTRFLRDGPLRAESGEAFIENFEQHDAVTLATAVQA